LTRQATARVFRRGRRPPPLAKDLPMSTSAEPSVGERYFVPVPDEITAHDLPVAGTLPPQLTGIYLRNGPNPRPGSPYPFFAGDGMVHGVRLEAGHAAW